MAGPYAPGSCVTSGGGSVGANAARAMTEAANGAYNRDTQIFEQAAQAQAASIERSINCVGEVTRSIASLIPSFGGSGIMASLANQAAAALANQACQMVTRTTNRVSQTVGEINNEISQAMGRSGAAVGGVIGPAIGPTYNTNNQANENGIFYSITQVLSSVF